MDITLLFGPTVYVCVEPLVLLAGRWESGIEFLLEVGVCVLELEDEPLHVGSHWRLLSENELLFLHEALPRGLDCFPLFIAEVARGPLDLSLAVHDN